MCNAFSDLFSNLFSLAFFRNDDYFLYLTCSNEKEYEGAESKEAKKNKRKQQQQQQQPKIFNSKK